MLHYEPQHVSSSTLLILRRTNFITTASGIVTMETVISTLLYIQGDSGEICNTLGNDSMCDSKQKSSYEHGSDFERLPRYGRKNFNAALAVML